MLEAVVGRMRLEPEITAASWHVVRLTSSKGSATIPTKGSRCVLPTLLWTGVRRAAPSAH